MLDVVVVFYTMACLGSDIFELAFQTLVNEVLPQMGRPYAVYRFSLDAEPRFVSEMAESLGLPEHNPVTSQGFAWSGPGRPLFIIGDRALQITCCILSVRAPGPAHSADASGRRKRRAPEPDIAERERWPRSQARLVGRPRGRHLGMVPLCYSGAGCRGGRR